MANTRERVKDFPSIVGTIQNDDYIPVDGATQGVRKAQVKDIMEAPITGLDTIANTTKGAINELATTAGKVWVGTQAEYDDLPDSKLTDKVLHCITDGEPAAYDSIWDKVGTDPLDTTASDCSGAINEINSSLSDLETSLQDAYTNLSLNSSLVNTIYIRNIIKFGNVKIANVGYLSKAMSTLNTWYDLCTLPSGYENLHAVEFQWFTRDKKSINIKAENNKISIVAREAVGANDLINFYIVFI